MPDPAIDTRLIEQQEFEYIRHGTVNLLNFSDSTGLQVLDL